MPIMMEREIMMERDFEREIEALQLVRRKAMEQRARAKAAGKSKP